jgi:hypothetical protein
VHSHIYSSKEILDKEGAGGKGSIFGFVTAFFDG